MIPAADVCYRALESRDPRFDGRFFIAVLTTGIYCRPVCSARTPRRRNVRFYASAAAAAEAGFRPCRRCRPESAPGTAAWRGTGAPVGRALQLIGEGALDDAGVPELAERVGLGERQLRRLFVRHLGASPQSVAATRRTHLAKKLLDETELPITEIAFASGFSSVRRFNDSMRRAFQAAPRELRRGARGSREGSAEIVLRLAFRAPLDWRGLLAFLAPRAIPGVEEVCGPVYRRSVRHGDEAGVIRVELDRDARALRLCAPGSLARSIGVLSARARRLFDLDADPHAIALHLRKDPLLRTCLGRRRGLRVPGSWEGFEVAVRAILGQQVSVAGATTLAGRLVERLGEPLCADAERGSITRTFPRAERLAEAGRGALAGIGLTRARAAALAGLSEAVARGRLRLDGRGDPGAVREALLALPGVGPWTASYIALRSGDPDAFPESDLGLRRAAGEGAAEPPSARELASRAEAWRPWRSYAALALWGG